MVGFVAALGAALDGLSGAPAWSMTPVEQRSTLRALRRQRARLEELELRVLVAADRNEVGAESGATSTASWLADATGSTRASCFQAVHLAHALDEDFGATHEALAAGEIDAERAMVVIHAVQALTDEHDDLPDGTETAAEAHLLDLARTFDAPTLRRLGKRVFEVVCPSAADEVEGRTLAEEEERARRLSYLTLRDNGDGTAEGKFRVPTLPGQVLRKALEALTSPRRLGQARQDPGTGKKLPHSTLLGHGLIELLESHLDLESLPGSGGSPFTLVVTVGVDSLMSGLGAAGVDTGNRISAGEARRLACTAGIIPMVMDGASVPLDLGRERRMFSKHQRIALAHRYGGCAATNCDRPPAQAEAHHLDPWHSGGRTDVKRGILLCPPHHHMADHPKSWDMRYMADGGVRFSRRT
ncbi:HNH endonuclease signature motif containing protein [soil metagenome]